ncbi:HNH endonuclease [Lysinibacillus sp. PLM2]|nr:HNH endonuclease [Lysinibacillus sp. PLM2]
MQEYKTEEQKRKFYDSYAWRKLSKQIKQRDNNECQECKRQGKVFIDTNEYSETAKRKKIQLVVHHKKELEFHPDLALEEDNLETICVDCHNKEHDRYIERKVNRWEHDEKW